jgi:5-formyltetrahydrofolate cyclo-ligase
VHVRPVAESLKRRPGSHLNLRFKAPRPDPAQAGDATLTKSAIEHAQQETIATVNDRNKLRRKIRQQRAGLSPQQVARASLRASLRVTRLPSYRRAKHIAAYIANDGEMDPIPILLDAIARGEACYLPRLHPFLKGRMWFIRWQPGDPLESNRFGIPEPLPRKGVRLPHWMLQLVIVPLVAFDAHMNRLGMGQGFYDRAFAFKRHRKYWNRPFLCGFAHAFQQTQQLPSQAWDVPLDAIATDHGIVTGDRTSS